MSHTHSYRYRYILVTALLLAIALLGDRPAAARLDGTISGRVTNSTNGSPLANVLIKFYEESADDFVATTTTDGNGDYSLSVPPGSYAMITDNTQGFINEIRHNNGSTPCSAVCDTSTLQFFVITTNSMPGMDFPLEPGGRMAGTVTATGGQPLAGVKVWFIDPDDGFPFTSATTDVNGQYLSDGGTATGIVYAITENNLGYQNEVFDNVKCAPCDIHDDGTPIAVTIGVTTGNINFALDAGGLITGTVTNSSGAGIAGVRVNVVSSTNVFIDEVGTDASGNYATGGLPAGTYYVSTRNSLGFVDEFYNNITCVNGFCDPTQPGGGTPIAVTVGATASGINFSLATGGTITGTVTNASGGAPLEDIFVGFFNAANQYLGGANTNESGGFRAAVPAGIVFAGVINTPGFASQMYNGFPCLVNCLVTNGTAIQVTAGGTVTGINFALSQGGSISGQVTGPSGAVQNSQVQVLTSSGTLIGNMLTNATGNYTLAGLLPGSYYVRTNAGAGTALINELYDNIPCNGCNPAALGGTLVAVVANGTTAGINFALATGGRISGLIRNADTLAVVQNVQAQFFTASGVSFGSVNSQANGTYISAGLPAGTYYVRTGNTLGFVNELYDNLPCPQIGCTLTLGAPVTVTTGVTTPSINFDLTPGGRISGTVTNASGGAPLGFINANIINEAGVNLGATATNASGVYTSSGLPAGTYYVRTSNNLGFVDELYDDIACVLCSAQNGAPVVVTGTATTSDVNFSLAAGGTVTGTVTDANTAAPLAGVSVQFYSQAGVFLRQNVTNSNGVFTAFGLAPGTYYARTAVGGSTYYFDELYNEMSCAATCTVTNGTGIVVVAGATQSGVNFTLTPGGGGISGTVTDAVTNGALSVTLEVYTQAGAFVKQAGSIGSSGTYGVAGLPAGSYFIRTRTSQTGLNYADELYNDISCLVTCVVTTGTPVVVANSVTTPNVNFALAPNMIQNSGFSNGAGGWTQFATSTGGTVDPTYIEWNVTNGVANFRRVPQTPGNPVNQAVMLRATGLPVGANQALLATFDLGNSSAQTKYMKVIVHDLDFSDLGACTFQFEPNAPIRRFQMLLHTTEAWTNATISFYASSPRTDAGYYQLDNVSLQAAPGASLERTDCIDPLAPVAPGGPDGPNLLTNGSFSSGMSSWTPLGTISVRDPMVGGVLELLRPANTPPPGVVLQATPESMTQSQILTLTLRLGNATAARKRALLIVHALNFSDLIACTWWLPAGQPLSNYKMIVYTSRPWVVASGANASVSIYPSVVSAADQWIQVDDVSLMRTPSAVTPGTRCLEGTEAAGAAPPAASATVLGAGLASAPALASPAAPRDGQTLADAPWTQTGDGWMAVADESLPRVLRGSDLIDLRDASEARLTFHSWLRSLGSAATVEVSADGVTWTDVGQVAASAGWQPVDVDLGAFLGQVVEVRFVLHGVRWSALEAPDVWRVRGVRIQVRDR